MRSVVVLVLAYAACPARADDPVRAAALRTVRADFETAMLNAVAARAKAPEAEKAELREAMFSRTLPPFVRKAADLVAADPADDTGFAAIVWLMEQQAAWNLVEPAEHPRLLALVEKHHLGRADVSAVVVWLPWLQLDPDDRASGERKTKFLARLLDESKHRAVRGVACLTLAEWAFRDYERAALDPTSDPQAVKAAAGRAETHFQRVEKEFGDVPRDPYRDRKDLDEFLRKVQAAATGKPPPEPKTPKAITLGESVAGYLIELRQLAVGQPAPPLAGDDLGGAKLSLADHKGKVVVVVFWASWCGPCMARVPAEIELASRLKGKPFALVGVNGDEDKDAAVKAEKRTGMTWPSVWAGNPEDSPILKAWNVRRWPTVYVLDHAGVIRGKDLHGKELDRLVDHLVGEAEKGGPKK